MCIRDRYLLFDVVLGLIPLALVALGLTTWDVPANVSALTASVLLLALLVFTRKQLVAEAVSYTHLDVYKRQPLTTVHAPSNGSAYSSREAPVRLSGSFPL